MSLMWTQCAPSRHWQSPFCPVPCPSFRRMAIMAASVHAARMSVTVQPTHVTLAEISQNTTLRIPSVSHPTSSGMWCERAPRTTLHRCMAASKTLMTFERVDELGSPKRMWWSRRLNASMHAAVSPRCNTGRACHATRTQVALQHHQACPHAGSQQSQTTSAQLVQTTCHRAALTACSTYGRLNRPHPEIDALQWTPPAMCQ